MAVRDADQSLDERNRDMGEDEVHGPSPRLGALGEVDVRVHGDRGRIRYIVQALCGTQFDADGVVAEAIASAVERLKAGRSIEDLRAWVTSAAVNLGRSEVRRLTVRRSYAPLLASSIPSDDGATENIALRLDVEAALRQLPRRQAQVVALHYGLDLSIGDIAPCLHRSEGTVKATLFKARRRSETTLRTPDGVIDVDQIDALLKDHLSSFPWEHHGRNGRLDGHRSAIGGIQDPWEQVPVAAYSGKTLAGSPGFLRPLRIDASLQRGAAAALYGSESACLKAYTKATDEDIQARIHPPVRQGLGDRIRRTRAVSDAG